MKKLLSLFVALVVCTAAQASDLKTTDIVVGNGKEAMPEQKVTVHYTGWLMTGEKFDSSLDRNKPFQFTLGAHEVIPGWDQGVEGMRVGGKRELVIPPELAYGPRGIGRVIPPNATLKFIVELLDVSDPAFKNIDNDELKALLEKGVTLVDIRTPREWQETGVIEGSKLLPFRMSKGKINPNFADDLKRIANPKDPLVLICRTGNRSRAAAEMMASQHGFEGIYNVRHGITYWMRKGNKTVRPEMDKLKTTCSLC